MMILESPSLGKAWAELLVWQIACSLKAELRELRISVFAPTSSPASRAEEECRPSSTTWIRALLFFQQRPVWALELAGLAWPSL